MDAGRWMAVLHGPTDDGGGAGKDPFFSGGKILTVSLLSTNVISTGRVLKINSISPGVSMPVLNLMTPEVLSSVFFKIREEEFFLFFVVFFYIL